MGMGNPNSVVKRAASFVGQELGPARAPFNVYDEKLDDAIRAALEAVERVAI